MADTHRRPPLPHTTLTSTTSTTTTSTTNNHHNNHNNDDHLRGLSQQDISSLRQYLSSAVVVAASPLNSTTTTSTQQHRMPHHHPAPAPAHPHAHTHAHPHHHHHHHPPASTSSNGTSSGVGGTGTGTSTSTSGSSSGNDEVHPHLYPLKCGALTPNHPNTTTTNDSGDSDGQPYPLPWYANRKAKQLSQKRSRAAAPSSNGCGTIIHNSSSRSERAWIARGYPTEAVVPLAREFFNQPDAKDGRMPCGCEWHGVGCRHCGAPLGEVFYPCPKHNRHGDSLPMFTFDIAYVTALGAPNTTTTADDLSTPSSSSSSSSSLTLSPSSSQASSLRTLRIDHPPSSSPRISTSTRHSHSHPPIVVTPNNPYVPTGAYPSSLPTVAGARPVIMARTHHPAQRPPPLPRPPRSPSCPGTPHDSEEDYSGSEEEITGASGSGGSYSDDSLPMTATGNPTPSPPRSNSQSSLQSC